MISPRQSLDALGIDYAEIVVDDTTYLVTLGTGERHYGKDLGGSAAFAYDSDDHACGPIDSYQEFCDEFCATVDRDVAIEAARQGLRLTSPGSCDPVLTDEEFLLLGRVDSQDFGGEVILPVGETYEIHPAAAGNWAVVHNATGQVATVCDDLDIAVEYAEDAEKDDRDLV